MIAEMTWLGIDVEQLAAGVATRQDIALKQAALCAKKISIIAPPLRDSFKEYWEIGALNYARSHAGYTIDDALNGRKRMPKMTPIGAFLLLDWMIRDPEAAQAALARGHDHIEFAT